MRKLLLGFLTVSILLIMPTLAQAGPFSDVPASSWVYRALQEEASKGLIVGYGDSTFSGKRLATRYEMAMVVARMLNNFEKGQDETGNKIRLNASDIATLMKLAEEFKPELSSLDVKVLALEKKSVNDSLRFSGDATFSFGSESITYYK
ncbi:S-layer homology domain-containing protein [Thermodesulfobium sp. 4217-1]|uniref:S-layer homology domain-containing protein n=1 Tax=Thermodesulfobium sp. 4217-1 TaxID=3120013 RepID=UPI000CBE9D53|nr:MAG: hypothetical protein C0174_06490 [Thermodesulfobium narugense]HEM56178.1 S-layer homology domain-containing protein [Thermodesulfobium narugense]